MSATKQKVIIAANPKSGASESRPRVNALHEQALQRGFDCEIVGDLEAVQQRALQAMSRRELRAVVSAGGDGTADALANLLPSDVPLLLFPLGTENLLAKHFALPTDVSASAEILENGRLVQVDVGSANGQLFLVMASCGFDAQVVFEMDSIRKGHINRWSYTKPIIRALSAYQFPQLHYQCDRSQQDGKAPQTDGASRSGSAAWIFVFNVPRYAANLQFCPQADPHDGQLDVCLFQRGGVAFGISYFLRLFLRSHQSMNGFRHLRCRELLVESGPGQPTPSASVPFQLDGDPGGHLPLEISVLPNRLTLLVAP